MKYKSIITTSLLDLDLADNATNLFILFENKYDDNGDIIENVFDLIEKVEARGFHFINNILVPLKSVGDICDNVLYIAWFTNDLKLYQVNKDPIREKSIWKDVEWGKRKKYNNRNNQVKTPRFI